jgi:penicillin amidase
MRLLRRILAGLAGLLALVLVTGAVAGAVAVRRSHPTVTGTLTLPGLTAPVLVERDAEGVPTIVASDADDLFRAQGFVHAQDRFWEMDFRRHVTAGRLSELFGASQLATDRSIRTLGWRRVAEAELALLAPETVAMLEAYADGVNAWLAGRTGSALSLEHALLPLTGARGYRPEPWTPADSLAWLKAMAWDLRSNLEQELERARLLGVDLGPGRSWEDLYPAFDAERHPPILPWGGGVVGGRFAPAAGTPVAPVAREVGTPAPPTPTRPTTAAVQRSEDGATARLRRVLAEEDGVRAALAATSATLASFPQLIGDGSEGIGSNSWVLAGSRTATGGAMLANDPHLAPALPSIWYQVRLRCAPVTEACPYDVAGFSFSGMPGIIIGHNDTVAWGFTNLGPDVADLVVERVVGDAVLTARGSAPLEVRTETIRVAGGAPVTHTVRIGPNGPLISDAFPSYATVLDGPLVEGAPDGDGFAIALRWVALDPAPTADAVPLLMRARDFDAFRAAAARFQVPSQNLLYADTRGSIGYQAPGLVPVRDGHDGTVPRLGWEGGAGWVRFLDFDEMPYVLDPVGGAIVTANQRVLPFGTGPFLHVDVAYGQRGRRIAQLLGDRVGLTLNDLAAVQMDNHNTNAEALVPHLVAVPVVDAGARTVQDLLRAWDLQDDVDSAAAAAFNATWRALLARTFHDELPAWAWPGGGGRWWEVVRGLLEEPDSAWWRDDAAGTAWDRDAVLALALADAHAELVALLGTDPAGWRWGALHTLTPTHATFGASGIGPVEWLFNRRPGTLEVAGGTDVVNSNAWTATEGYTVDWVPSMRMLVDLTDLDAGRWIHLTGQSGRPFHRHYGDLAERWRVGGYAPMRFSPGATATAARDVLTLIPPG